MASKLIEKLRVDLEANASNFTSTFKKADTTANRRLRKIERRTQAASAAIGRTLKSSAFVIGGAVTALAAFEVKTLDTIDKTGKLAKQIGIGTKALSGLQFAAEQTGASADTLNSGLGALEKRLGKVAATGKGTAKDALEQLGLSAKALAKLNPDEQIKRIADAMKGLDSQSQRNAVAADLFSRSNQSLVNTLALGRQGIERMQQRAEDLGRTLDEKQTQAAARANDAINRMKSALKGAAFTAATAFTPTVVKMSDKITNFINNLQDDGKIENFFKNITNYAGDLLDQIVSLVKGAVVLKGALSGLKLGFMAPGGPIVKGAGALTGAVAGGAGSYAAADYAENVIRNVGNDSQSGQASAPQQNLDRQRRAVTRKNQARVSDLNTKQQALRDSVNRLDKAINSAVPGSAAIRGWKRYRDSAIKQINAIETKKQRLLEYPSDPRSGSRQTAAVVIEGRKPNPKKKRDHNSSTKTITRTASTNQLPRVQVPQTPQYASRSMNDSQGIQRNPNMQRVLDVEQQVQTQAERINARYQQQKQIIQSANISEQRRAKDLTKLQAKHKQQIDQLGQSYSTWSSFADQAARNIQNTLGNTLEQTLTGNFDSIKNMWIKTLQKMVTQAAAADLGNALIGKSFGQSGKIGGLVGKLFGGQDGKANGFGEIAANIGSKALGVFKGGGTGGGIMSGLGRVFGGFFANGGTMPANRASVVGEEGPELAIPNRTTQVLPNKVLNGLGSGGNVTVNVINEGGQQLQQDKTNKRRGANNEQIVDVYVKQSLHRVVNSGELDSVMQSNYGVQRKTTAG